MITLNSDKGLVRIECWEDVVTRPGFLAQVDPRTVKLKEIIGSYSFRMSIPCGLSTCRQPHENGFLVVTEQGFETNIGNVCGRRNFSVEFSQLRKIYMALTAAARRREILTAIKHRASSIRAELDGMKSGPRGASWQHSCVSKLLGRVTALPQPIVNAVREAVRRGGGRLTIQRAATAAERSRQAVATHIAGLEMKARTDFFVEVEVGQLEGFRAITPGDGIRELILSISELIDTVDSADIEQLTHKDLRSLSKAAGDLDAKLDQLREVIGASNRLLTKDNLQQLVVYLKRPADLKLFQMFLDELR